MARPHLRRILLVLLCVVACFAQAAASKKGRNVQIGVLVTSRGTPVLNLQAQDFTILDGGVACPIVSIQIVTPTQSASPKQQTTPSAAAAAARSQQFPVYEIVYVRPSSAVVGTFRQVEVRVDRPNLSVKAPRGYKVAN